MDPKLQAWLDTLSPADKDKALKALGELAAGPQDKAIVAARLAAGLPERAPATIDAIRKAAGLEAQDGSNA